MAGDRFDSELGLALESRGRNWTVQVPGKRFMEPLRESAVLSPAGAYTLTDPVDVFKSRWLHLYIAVSTAILGNIVTIIPEVSLDPSGADDTFYPIGKSSGTVTLADLAVDPGGEYSIHNLNGETFAPWRISTPAAKGADDELRMTVPIWVEQAYHIRFRVAETGIVGTPSTLKLDYAKSV